MFVQHDAIGCTVDLGDCRPAEIAGARRALLPLRLCVRLLVACCTAPARHPILRGLVSEAFYAILCQASGCGKFPNAGFAAIAQLVERRFRN